MSSPAVVEVPDVVVERFIRAAPERVFEALTNPKDLERWFFSEMTTDPRPGGGYHATFRFQTDPAKDHSRSGRYLEFVPSQKLVFEWNPTDSGNDCVDLRYVGPTIVTITLTAEKDGTRLRLVHSGWKKDERTLASRNGHNDGWSYFIEHLGSYLIGGPDTRGERLGQRVRH